MKVTYDPHKDQINQGKHQLSLDEAHRIEWDTLYATEDKRQGYSVLKNGTLISLMNTDKRRKISVYL